jgi:hypothetical protein
MGRWTGTRRASAMQWHSWGRDVAWIEQTARRTQKAKIYQDSADPARQRAEFTISDRHYHDGAAWQDVDDAFVTGTVTGFAHKCEAVRHAIHIGATGTRRWCPRRDHPDEYVEFGRLQSWSGTAWGNVNLGTPTRTGNKITWSTTAFDLSLTNTWHRIKIEAKLKTEAARRRLRWAVSLHGLTWDNWTLVSASDSTIVGTIDKPTAWDATATRDEPNVTITTTYSGGYVEFGGDLAGKTLPITIDPTFTDGYGGDANTAFDTWMNSGNPGTSVGGDDTMYVKGDLSYRSLLKFTLSSLSDYTINAANLYLTDISGYGKATAIHRILSANSGMTEDACWNYKDGESGGHRWAGDTGADGGADAGCTVSGTDYASTVMGTASPHDPFTTPSERNCTLDLTEFGSMIAANYGMHLYATEGTWQTVGFATSDHATTGYRPKLVVDYTAGGGSTGNPHYAYAQQ